MDEDNGWTNSSLFRHYCHFVSQYMHINLFCTIIIFFCIEKFVLLPEEKKLSYYYKTIKYLGLRFSIKLMLIMVFLSGNHSQSMNQSTIAIEIILSQMLGIKLNCWNRGIALGLGVKLCVIMSKVDDNMTKKSACNNRCYAGWLILWAAYFGWIDKKFEFFKIKNCFCFWNKPSKCNYLQKMGVPETITL